MDNNIRFVGFRVMVVNFWKQMFRLKNPLVSIAVAISIRK
jgi:hypothetical protein